MTIPKGWKSRPDDTRVNNLKIGEKMTNNVKNQSATTKLLGLRKALGEKYPIFMSGIIKKAYLSSGEVHTPKEYLEYQAKLLEKANISLNKTYGRKVIDGPDFSTYTFNRAGSSVFQKGLTCFRSNNLFYVTWVYQNEEDDETIQKMIEKSTFKKD